MRRGELVAIMDAAGATQEKVMQYAA
jgi:hypothetical protein